MASFTAYLEVGGKSYPLYRYEMSMHQETDTLGRPASPVLGGSITCTLSSPGSTDPFLYQWAMSPTMQQDGKIRLLQAAPKATEKTISFFNAYCTGLDLSFQPGQEGGGGSSLIQVTISPQRIAVGAIMHDNNWPVASHGAGESFAKQQAEPSNGQPKKDEEPSAFMEGLHGVLDVVGMIPIIGEVADAANAGLYLAQGRYGEAALSAASMIPLAGNIVGGAKLLRRGTKLIAKARGLKAIKTSQKLLGGTIRNVNKVGGKMNCANCSIAVDSILAGRPASALNTKGPVYLSTLEKFFGKKFKHNMTSEQLEKALPDPGDRGIVFGNRGVDKNGKPIVGHFFNIVNQKGKIRYLDGQTGKAADLTNGFINFSLLRTN